MPARRGHCRYGPCRAPRQTRRDARSRSGDDADQLRRTLVPQGPPFLKVRSCFGEAESEPTRSSRGAEAPLLHDIKLSPEPTTRRASRYTISRTLPALGRGEFGRSAQVLVAILMTFNVASYGERGGDARSWSARAA